MIIKEKNLVKFIAHENAKPYTLDINTGCLIGVRGATLVNVPVAVKNIIRQEKENNNILFFLDYFLSTNRITDLPEQVNALMTVDKITSLGYHFQHAWDCEPRILKLIGENFKLFSKWVREDDNNNSYLTEFSNYYERVAWCNNHHIELHEHTSIEMIDFIRRNFHSSSAENVQTIYRLLNNELWVAFYTTYRIDMLKRFLVDYLQMTNTLGFTPTKNNFFKDYSRVKQIWDSQKDERDAQALRFNQVTKTDLLSFENEYFKVIIPTTREEFVAEGEAQHNCVGRLYIQPVIEGETNIVFIRKKEDLDTSYITCEVRNRRIQQYLSQYNRAVRDTLALEFCEAYAKHLLEYEG